MSKCITDIWTKVLKELPPNFWRENLSIVIREDTVIVVDGNHQANYPKTS